MTVLWIGECLGPGNNFLAVITNTYALLLAGPSADMGLGIPDIQCGMTHQHLTRWFGKLWICFAGKVYNPSNNPSSPGT